MATLIFDSRNVILPEVTAAFAFIVNNNNNKNKNKKPTNNYLLLFLISLRLELISPWVPQNLLNGSSVQNILLKNPADI